MVCRARSPRRPARDRCCLPPSTFPLHPKQRRSPSRLRWSRDSRSWSSTWHRCHPPHLDRDGLRVRRHRRGRGVAARAGRARAHVGCEGRAPAHLEPASGHGAAGACRPRRCRACSCSGRTRAGARDASTGRRPSASAARRPASSGFLRRARTHRPTRRREGGRRGEQRAPGIVHRPLFSKRLAGPCTPITATSSAALSRTGSCDRS